MEMELKNIIEKIKSDGVEEAEKKSQEIIADAEVKANEIINKAKEEAKKTEKESEEKSESMKKRAEDAIKQASRDVLLGLRESIVSLFDKVVKRKLSGELNPEVLKEMLLTLVKNFKKDEISEVEILLNESDRKELEKIFFTELQENMKKGVELKASPSVEHGFRIGEKNSNSYYDFTDDAIEEAFKSYLNKKLREILIPGAESGE